MVICPIDTSVEVLAAVGFRGPSVVEKGMIQVENAVLTLDGDCHHGPLLHFRGNAPVYMETHTFFKPGLQYS